MYAHIRTPALITHKHAHTHTRTHTHTGMPHLLTFYTELQYLQPAASNYDVVHYLIMHSITILVMLFLSTEYLVKS